MEKENEDLVNKINEYERSIEGYRQRLTDEQLKLNVNEFILYFQVFCSSRLTKYRDCKLF